MKSFDPIWENKYAAGLAQRYPWDIIVTFVYRSAPRDRPRQDVRVLEVGCGSGSNLWFAAREGFAVAGIDASDSGIQIARQRLTDDGLQGDLRVGNFTQLPFPDASFDLVLDRCSLTCCDRASVGLAVAEIHRVLKPGGRFFFNPYGKNHTSYVSAGKPADGFVETISAGTLVGVGHICFYERDDLMALLGQRWTIESMQRMTLADEMASIPSMHEEWRVVARKS